MIKGKEGEGIKKWLYLGTEIIARLNKNCLNIGRKNFLLLDTFLVNFLYIGRSVYI